MEQNKINGQLYRQVFIRSESDLPKEDGFIEFVKHKGFDEVKQKYYTFDDRTYWLSHIDWYLLPVEPEPPVYDEQYLNDCIKKATPGLSKIKDVDEALDEIRGIKPQDNYIPQPFKFCPGCGKDWEEDSEQFGCWSCGWSKHKITMINKLNKK